MRHVRQQGMECLLASICQLIPDLDYEKVRPRYDSKRPLLWAFREPHVPPVVYEIILAQYSAILDKFGGFSRQKARLAKLDTDAPDLSGRGILSGYNGWVCHAVSYEYGMILDPEQEFVRETWEQFSGRWAPPLRFWWTVPLSTEVPLTAGSIGVTIGQT